MKKNDTVVCALLAILIFSQTFATASEQKPMNFLVMLADDIGATEIGCYGNTVHKTPNIDALAKQGTMFKTAYVTPICSPSRVMVMTGRYGFRTGWYNLMGRPGSPTVVDPNYDLGEAELTFADVAKSRGYATAMAGKWQLTGQHPTLIHDCGFDEYRMWAFIENLPEGVTHSGGWEGKPGAGKTARYWHPSIVENGKYLPTSAEDYGPDLFSDFLVDFMRRNRDRPFLAYYAMNQPHEPYDPVPDLNHPGQQKSGGLKNNIEYLDYIVGKMTKAVDDLGLTENTVIFFIGDNGTGENGTRGKGKGKVKELGVRVPFIVRCPGFVKPAVLSNALVSGVDVLPTIAELAGAELPQDRVIDGVSLVQTLKDPSVEAREWLFSYMYTERMLRDKRWLLEGNGKFFDCGSSRDGVEFYKNVTNSTDAEVLAAKRRFQTILEDLPAMRQD